MRQDDPRADVRVAVQAFIYREDGYWLFFQRPGRPGWATLAGKLKLGEDVDEGLLREIGEEIGPDVRVELEKTVDAHTWDLPEGRYVSIFKLVRYLGGQIELGSDMADAEWAWIAACDVPLLPISVPQQAWIVAWALQLAALLRNERTEVRVK